MYWHVLCQDLPINAHGHCGQACLPFLAWSFLRNEENHADGSQDCVMGHWCRRPSDPEEWAAVSGVFARSEWSPCSSTCEKGYSVRERTVEAWVCPCASSACSQDSWVLLAKIRLLVGTSPKRRRSLSFSFEGVESRCKGRAAKEQFPMQEIQNCNAGVSCFEGRVRISDWHDSVRTYLWRA